MAQTHPLARTQKIEVHPQGKYYTMAVAFVVVVDMIAFGTIFIDFGIRFGETTLRYGGLFFAFCLAYSAASWRPVQTDEMSGIMVLEKPAREVGAGWHFVPLWITELHRVPLAVQQVQFPGDPERVFKGRDDEPLPEGMFRPLRATTHAPKKGKKYENDMLNVQMTIEITFSVRWALKRVGSFFTFYVNIPGADWEEKRANILQQMRDSGETDLVEEIASHTLGEVLADIANINSRLSKCIQENVNDWGIDIREARMQAPDITHELNEALADIPTANARLKRTITDSEGEKIRLTNEGEGRAAAIKVETAARGEGLKAAATALGMEGGDYAALEMAREAIGKGDIIIGPSGVDQLVGLGKAVLGAGRK